MELRFITQDKHFSSFLWIRDSDFSADFKRATSNFEQKQLFSLLKINIETSISPFPSHDKHDTYLANLINATK